MTDPAITYVHVFAAALATAEVPGATNTDPIMALLALAASMAEAAGASREGFVKCAGMAYDWESEHGSAPPNEPPLTEPN